MDTGAAALRKRLAVPYLGAMALKQNHSALQRQSHHTCSPLPRGDGAETSFNASTIKASSSCSPLPRGDGAETSLRQVMLRLSLLAVPYLGAMALKRSPMICPSAPQTCLQSPTSGRWR